MNSRITQSMITRNTLLNIEAAARRVSKAQEQASSGLVINRPSDDPVGTIRALGFQTSLTAAQQYQKNVEYATGWVDTTEQAISGGISLLQRARELTLQAANDSMDAASRATIADELIGIVDDLKALGNTKLEDTFVFGGTLTDNPPYTLGASDAYAGNTTLVRREIGPGVQPDISAYGTEVFGDDTSGLLLHLRQIITHVQGSTPADMAQLQGPMVAALDGDLNQMLAVQTRVGALQSRFERAASRLSDMEFTSRKLLSNTVEVDIAKAIVEFQQQETSYRAALQSGAKVMQPSLMDFLR